MRPNRFAATMGMTGLIAAFIIPAIISAQTAAPQSATSATAVKPAGSSKNAVETRAVAEKGAKTNAAPQAVDSAAAASAGAGKPTAAEGVDLPAERWAGRRFELLRMPAPYQKQGYDLYLTERLGRAATPVKPEIELQNRRLRYDRFVGKTLRATLVTRPDEEVMIRFMEEESNLAVFGKTTNGVIKGLALTDDRAQARQRWLGKKIFSHRGYYNRADGACTTITSIKVPLDMPLKVVDVIFGVSPLPPQTLWMMIETPDTLGGFIPVFYTWTNVPAQIRRKCRPWQEEILETNPRTQLAWDKVTWEMANNHKVGTGMLPQQVWISWGEPLERDSMSYQGRKAERWSYQSQEAIFIDGTLAATRER